MTVLFLGLDTSAYVTSLALVDGEEQLVWEKRLTLPVAEGKLGLRQAEAVFAHLKNVPLLWREGAFLLGENPVAAVAASTRPRPLPRSYMPVFKVGEAFGSFVAAALQVPFMPVSHQEGHLMAGFWSCGLPPERCLALHLSGGTTEILAVEESEPGRLAVTLLGGSSDLNAGQFVDRVGRKMGLSFPAGKELEALAQEGQTGAVTLPVAVRGTAISFSGPATHAERLLAKGCPAADLARAVEVCVADSLARAVQAVENLSSYRVLLLVGGVAANSFIRRRLASLLQDLTLVFADPAYAGDNAVGVAVLACRKYLNYTPA